MATAAEYGLGPNTYPRGWFIVAESREIDNGPIGVTFFGRDFAFIGREWQPGDARCLLQAHGHSLSQEYQCHADCR